MPDFARMMDEMLYSIIASLAGVHWGMQKAVLMAGYTVKLINQWLIQHAFMPIIGETNDSLRVAVNVVFVVALLVLGITYMLAAFIRLEIVSPRNAMMWYVAGALFFAIGPSLYQGMNDFRMKISETMYVSVSHNLTDNAGDFSSLSQVNSHDLDMALLCDQFDVYLPGATGPGGKDGLDIAMAYLRAHAYDVMGYDHPVYSGCDGYTPNLNSSTFAGTPGTSVIPLDWNWNGGYFDHTRAPHNWDSLTAADRAAAVSWAGASQQRALTAWPLLLFGLVEQIVQLLITIALGITFVSFGIAILFAFFKRTESIAQSIVDQWIELLVQSTIIGLMQALVIGFFLAGVATGSAVAIIGISLICLVCMLIALWSGVKAVWNSFNRLFNAMSQVSGGVIASPGAATAVAAGAGALAAGAAVSVGSNALTGMSALNQGATRMQAAGLSFGGSQALSGAMRAIAYTPSLRETPMGDAAEQFLEGASARRIAKTVPKPLQMATGLNLRGGVGLLSDRDPAKADYDEKDLRVLGRPMLLPAVGARLEGWTNPQKQEKDKRTGWFTPDLEAEEGDSGRSQPAKQRAIVAPENLAASSATTQPATEKQNSAPSTGEDRRQRERSDHNAEMVGEEMEQHISDVMGTKSGSSDAQSLERAALALTMAASALQRGTMDISGSRDVGNTLADAMRLIERDQTDLGGYSRKPVDHIQAGQYVAEAAGVTPVKDRTPIGGQDLARLGLFINQAQASGLSPNQVGGLVHEVKSSPTGQLRDGVRDTLTQVIVAGGKQSYPEAQRSVERLESSAMSLPNNLSIYGMVSAPSAATMTPTIEPQITVNPAVNVTVSAPTQQESSYERASQKEAAMGGSGSVLGG